MTPDPQSTYAQASIQTASMLCTVATSDMARDLSHLSMPAVEAVVQAGRAALAERIPQDHVNAYALGLNRYVEDLRRVTLASRQKHADIPEEALRDG